MEEITKTQYFFLQDKMDSGEVQKIAGELTKSVHGNIIMYRDSHGKVWVADYNGIFQAEKKLIKKFLRGKS